MILLIESPPDLCSYPSAILLTKLYHQRQLLADSVEKVGPISAPSPEAGKCPIDALLCKIWGDSVPGSDQNST
jgi:hypothetical protein